MATTQPLDSTGPASTLDPVRAGLHEAGWYARADLDQQTIDGLVSDVLDLVRESLVQPAMVRHIENFVPLGFRPGRDPYANVTQAAAGILAEAAASMLTVSTPSDADLIERAFPDRSAGRFCATCGQHGSHHTDQHASFLDFARREYNTVGP